MFESLSCGCGAVPFLVSAQVLIPNFGDMNCDGSADVVDVQLAIVAALGLPMNPVLDADGDGIPDTCQSFATSVSGNCVVGQVIQWNGTVWACADGTPGPAGAAGAPGLDGKIPAIEVGPSPSTCPNGGKVLFIGFDADGNGALAGSEVTQTVDLCDGAPGLPGAPGAPGVKGDPGTAGQEGAAGVSVVSTKVNASGQLVSQLSNGVESISNTLMGPEGLQGLAGSDGAAGAKGDTGAKECLACHLKPPCV